MRAFQFRLQTKLDVSTIEQGIAREQLHHSILTRDEVADRLDLLTSQLLTVEKTIRNWDEIGGSFQTMVSCREFLPVLNQKKARVNQELDLADEKVEKDRDIVARKLKETSILEKLKDRDWSSYQRASQMEEQKLIDEVANSQFYRNRMRAAGA